MMRVSQSKRDYLQVKLTIKIFCNKDNNSSSNNINHNPWLLLKKQGCHLSLMFI